MSRSLGLAALLLAAPAAAQLHSRAVTLGRPLASPRVVTIKEYSGWTPSDYAAAAGKHLAYGPIAQELLPATAFSPAESRLIDRLRRDSTAPKFVRSARAEKYQGTLEWARRLGVKLSDAELREHASYMAAKKRSVEAGAWRVEFESGRAAAAAHTSSRESAVATPHVNSALRALLVLADRSGERLATIQYFHTHPDASYLSPGDEGVLRELHAQTDVPVHIYAIPNVPGRNIVFHIGAAR